MWNGYAGKILEVDLSTGTIESVPLNKEMAQKYIGGKGFGIYTLYHRLPVKCAPLSADNMMVFATGPLTGSQAPASGRLNIEVEDGHGTADRQVLHRLINWPGVHGLRPSAIQEISGKDVCSANSIANPGSSARSIRRARGAILRASASSS